MPRYFFHVRNGKGLEDTEGTDKPDIVAARIEAVVLAGYLLRDYPEDFLSAEDWWIEVADKRGLMLFRLDVLSTDSPVLRADPLTLRQPASISP